MAKLGQTFIPSEIEDDGYVGGGGPVPAGKYLMQMVKNEMIPIKGDKGDRLNMDFQILEGPYEGRHVFQSLNIEHIDFDARQIPLKQFKRLCEACGQELVDDGDQLLHIPFYGAVIVRKNTQYGDQNDLTNYAPYGKQKAPAPRQEAQKRPLERSQASQSEAQASRSQGGASGGATRGDRSTSQRASSHSDAPWHRQ